MKYFQLLLVIFLCFSCTGNTIYEKPKNLIPKDSMILLLTDMHIASSAKHTKNKSQQKDINYMTIVYEKYKIDSVRFDVSNTYYTSKIDEYDKLLAQVKKRLEVFATDIQKQINDRDSLINIEKGLLNKNTDSLKLEEVELSEEHFDSLKKINLEKKFEELEQKN